MYTLSSQKETRLTNLDVRVEHGGAFSLREGARGGGIEQHVVEIVDIDDVI